MNKIFRYIAVALFVAALPLPAFAQEAAPAPAAEKSKKKAKKETRTPSVTFEFSGKEVWKTNYPPFLFPPEEKKRATRFKGNANVIEDRGGYYVEKKEVVRDAESVRSFPLAQTQRIGWPDKDPRLEEAQAELLRGNPSGALGIAERFLAFFAPLKTVEGSPWIRAAVIKLDALDQQANDSILDMFIGEIEATPGYQLIEGLPQKIKLARLNQLVRRGENAAVLVSADEMIRGQTNTEMLARLHIIKGNALYNLARYDEALNVFLRIPVFYGNEASFVPAAKLAVARCLKRMDKPELRAMNLSGYAEEYLTEIITEYPMSLEAKVAFEELPKHKRDALEAAGSMEERAAKRAAVTSQIENPDAEDGESGGSGSDDDSYTDDSTTSDDSDYE